MADEKTKEEIERGEFGTNEHHPDEEIKAQALLNLLEYTYNTNRERLPELSNIPLDKVRPLTFMRMFAKSEALNFCKELSEAQKKYFAHWSRYHPYEKCQSDEERVKWKEWQAAATDWEEMVKPEKLMLLAEDWLYYFLQFRRSIDGDHLKGARVLADRQIEATAEQVQEQSITDKW